jgi:ferredoxin, 2Fe-2S
MAGGPEPAPGAPTAKHAPARVRIEVLPHAALCPAGRAIEAPVGQTLIDALLDAGIEIEHACDKVGACATCHVHLRSGEREVAPADDEEEDELGNAWGVDAQSRLACCVRLKGDGLVVELPRFSRNHARER